MSKGFTLIEIIVSVAILAVIGITVGTNLSGYFQNQAKKDKVNFENKIISAAEIYFYRTPNLQDLVHADGNTTGETIVVNDLIEEGLLSKNLIDPETEEKVNLQKKVRFKYDKYLIITVN